MLKSSRRGGMRLSFVILIVVGVIAVAIVPMILATLVAEQRAEVREHEALDLYAQRGLRRVEVVFDNARNALVELDAIAATPCSDAAIAQMRHIALTNRYVQDAISLDDNNLMHCSALMGKLDQPKALSPHTWKGKLYRVWLKEQDIEATGRPLLALASDKNVVLLDPESMVDVISEYDALTLGVVNADGTQVVAAWRNANRDYLLKAFRHPASRLDDGNYYVVAKSTVLPIAMVAGEPSENLVRHWYATLRIWLPLGALLGCLAATALLVLVRQRLSMTGQLREAIRRKQLEVHYQPIVDLITRRCIGAEALVRWRNADGKLIRPDLFVPLAEEAGMIQPLTDLVLEIICTELAATLKARPDLYVSINLAAVDLGSPRFLQLLGVRLSTYGIAPEQICIEATERGFMHADTARTVIQALRDAGHRVFIDDFGTGYSGLSYLQSFQVDALKIDKSFVDTVGTEAATASVAPHIVQIGHSLNLKLIAEGVETQAQADWLAERGVQCGQGWLFAKAMPVALFLAYLAQDSQSDAI